MNRLAFFVVAITIFLSGNPAIAGGKFIPKNDRANSIVKLDNYYSLYQWGDALFLGGQPNLETLEMLHKKGVDLLINLSSEDEIEEFTDDAFDEQKMADHLGMKYVSIPIGDYNPSKLERFNKAVNTPHKKIFIHCYSGFRVTQLLMAYLIKYEDFDVDEAVAVGKKLKYSFPLEELLDQEISMKLKKK